MTEETTQDERFKHVTEKTGFVYSPPRTILTNVSLHNRGYALEWNLDLLDDGNKHAQDEWTALLATRTWRLPTTIEYIQVISRLKAKSQSEDFPKSQEQVLFELICKVFDQSPVATSTRVTYNSSGHDKVTHFYGKHYALDLHSKNFRGTTQYVGLGNSQEELLQSLFSDAEQSYQSRDKRSILRLQDALTLKRGVRGCGNTYTDAYPFLQRLESSAEGSQTSPVFFHLSDTVEERELFSPIVPDNAVLKIIADTSVDTPAVALGVRARRLEDVNL